MNMNDSVKISEDVILKIAETAALEVEGVLSAVSKNTKSGKAVAVTTLGDGLSVNIQLMYKDGFKIMDVSEKVQSHVSESIENMTGTPVKAVNVTVVGISSK